MIKKLDFIQDSEDYKTKTVKLGAKYLKNITFHIGLAKNYLEIENWNETSYSEIEEYLNSEMLQAKHKK